MVCPPQRNRRTGSSDLPLMSPSHHPGIPPDDSRQEANTSRFTDCSEAQAVLYRRRRDVADCNGLGDIGQGGRLSMPLLRMRGAASGDDMNLTSACAASRCFDTASTLTAKSTKPQLRS